SASALPVSQPDSLTSLPAEESYPKQGDTPPASGNVVGLLLCGTVQSTTPHTSGAGTVCSRTLFSSLCPYVCCKRCSRAGSAFLSLSSELARKMSFVQATLRIEYLLSVST
ncbi:hypothetical protein GBAR_LOCUS26100, partial [Geodia barretti]